LGIRDAVPFEVVEVSFKNGSRKEFFKNPGFTHATTGDWVVVESVSGGYDVGKVSLSGELVRLQLKRKRVRADARFQGVVRKAHDRDLERLDEVRRQEKEVMVKARAIARSLDLDMKVGDVEFQGDGRKCTFFYTADGRVDFRELIRLYAKEFKVKIEMRQIGARQESARIGGLGNCGRELCCSTWLTEFKSVNTAAARYQNLAINQTKLSGMCGRLKCCLNYELDTYIDALEDFPDRADRIKTHAGTALLIKTDVFKRLMYYTYAEDRGRLYPLHVDQIWEALDLVKSGKLPGSLDDIAAMAPPPVSDEPEEEEPEFENVQDVIQLPIEKRKKKKKKKSRDRSQSAAAALEKEPVAVAGSKPGSGNQQNRNQRPQGARSGSPDRRGEGGRPENKSQPPRPEQREGKPDNRPQPPRPERREGKPDNRPPQSPRPEQREGKPDNRPPQSPRPEQREGKPDNRPPQQPRPEQREGKPDNRPQPPRPERREGKPDSRPPQPPRPEQREGKSDNRPPQPPRPEQPNDKDQRPPSGGHKGKPKWPDRSKDKK
jgi:cell fate regulator YaaT (PSP1 superfamily)